MRVQQIKTLAWLANGVVLAGAAVAAAEFHDTYAERLVRTEVAWPGASGGATTAGAVDGRVDGDLVYPFVNGIVPVDDPGPEDDSGPPDPIDVFVGNHTYVGLIRSLPDTYDSIGYVRPGGGDTTFALRPGERLGDFTLIGFEDEAEGGARSLIFVHRVDNRIVRLTTTSQTPGVFTEGVRTRLVTRYNELAGPAVMRDTITVGAFPLLHEDASSATWYVPGEEVAWWRRFGQAEVLERLETETALRADGTPYGLRILSEPGAGTPVAEGRGLGRGDVVTTIDAAVIRTKSDVLRHVLRAGNAARRYVVEVENAEGATRTLTYRVAR